MQSLRQLSKVAARSTTSKRWLQTTAARHAITNFTMPAMSPTMTEGGISSWKKKEGEKFSAGDVLLEVETDKATMDVEAPDDGVMGKILAPDGSKNIPVGQVIALLAEEGDDISNLQPPADLKPPAAPKQEAPPTPPPTSTPTPPPPASIPEKQQGQPSPPEGLAHHHMHPESSHPLFPSVVRLLEEAGIQNADEIKGTGVRGMLTKGDVLAYLGKASSPLGTYKVDMTEGATPPSPPSPPPQKQAVPVLDGAAVRRLIVNNMLQASLKAQAAAVPKVVADFDSIIADYLPATESTPSAKASPAKAEKASAGDLEKLLKAR
ncbi:single hybrid motif-containing protein [Laetiporus sulphureus 93-53]|uniref:Single hybrid motif-containing protein n=1 Tax=Laetiporus sulphureus 93-53 TaxID=1314785 RepID=A0A165HD69_9APHY|nr:single hybrid motif-containing protein [Laetiporus sulphureus 93-53]KZT11578.1 single hybrid motif-containing protein [Laetiporus sulphureus 93-53]